jgi:hypothetical protein
VAEKESPVSVGAFIRRVIVPVGLAIAGLVAIVEGVWYHPIPVLVKTETTKTISIPLVIPPGPDMNGPLSPGGRSPFPPGMPFGRPNVMKQTVTETTWDSLVISEPDATRDVTVGGLERIVSGEHAGELKRTYSGGKGPALCPT